MEQNGRKKIKFKRSRVILTWVLFVLSVAAYSTAPFIPPDHRYLRQLSVLVGTLLMIATLFSFLRLFTYEIRMELYRRMSRVLVAAGEKWRSVKARVRKFFGLPERADLRGKDERTIVTADRERRNRNRPLPRARYSDMKENRARIRFLWAKYVIDRADREDPPVISDTPREIGDKLSDDDVKDGLFALYRTARYAPDDVRISDRDVVREAELVGTSGKI